MASAIVGENHLTPISPILINPLLYYKKIVTASHLLPRPRPRPPRFPPFHPPRDLPNRLLYVVPSSVVELTCCETTLSQLMQHVYFVVPLSCNSFNTTESLLKSKSSILASQASHIFVETLIPIRKKNYKYIPNKYHIKH